MERERLAKRTIRDRSPEAQEDKERGNLAKLSVEDMPLEDRAVEESFGAVDVVEQKPDSPRERMVVCRIATDELPHDFTRLWGEFVG